MKSGLLILIMVIIAFTLSGEFVREEQIPPLVYEHFSGELPSGIPVTLDFYAGRFTRSLEIIYKEELLSSGFQLFEHEQDNYLHLSIDYENRINQRSSGFLFFRKSYKEEDHHFAYQVTAMPQGLILDFDHLTLKTITEERIGNMRWYDPILISAIIGTLAYLFYFGGN